MIRYWPSASSARLLGPGRGEPSGSPWRDPGLRARSSVVGALPRNGGRGSAQLDQSGDRVARGCRDHRADLMRGRCGASGKKTFHDAGLRICFSHPSARIGPISLARRAGKEKHVPRGSPSLLQPPAGRRLLRGRIGPRSRRSHRRAQRQRLRVHRGDRRRGTAGELWIEPPGAPRCRSRRLARARSSGTTLRP